MTPEEQQIIDSAAQRLRQARDLRAEALTILEQLMGTTFTVEPGAVADGGNGNQTFTVDPTLVPAAAPRTDATFTVEPSRVPGNASQNPNQTFTVNGSPFGGVPGPSCAVSPIQGGNYMPSPGPSSIASNGPISILRPCGNPGLYNAGRTFNAGRTVTFGGMSPDSTAFNWSRSSPESSQLSGRNGGRPTPANPGGYSRGACPPQQANGNCSRATSYPDGMLTGSEYQDMNSLSMDSNSFGRIWTVPQDASSSTGRDSQLHSWMESSVSSPNGTGSIPGSATFADLNSSRVEASNESSTSTDSAVYCPHCGHSLNMNVNIQAPINSNSSEQNLRVRINFFDNSSAGSNNSDGARSNSGFAATGSMDSNNNPLGVNCPNCNGRIFLRLNIQQNVGSSSDSEQEFQVQIGLLTSPESPRNNSNPADSYYSEVSVYNCCGDGLRLPQQRNPKSDSDKS